MSPLILDALTLWPTFAWSVMAGPKNFENRSWVDDRVRRIVDGRLPLAIHASKLETRAEYRQTVAMIGVRAPELVVPPWESIVRGAMLGVVYLDRLVSPAERQEEDRWHFEGQWGWRIERKEPFEKPVKNVRGYQRLWKWTVPASLREKIQWGL